MGNVSISISGAQEEKAQSHMYVDSSIDSYQKNISLVFDTAAPSVAPKPQKYTLYLRVDTYWLSAVVDRKRVRISLRTDDRGIADQAARRYLDSLRQHRPCLDAINKQWVGKALCAAKARAAKTGKPFGLTRSDLVLLLLRSGGACEVTGIAFNLTSTTKHKNRPFAPSIDRINSRLPYTMENCRLVCVAANLAINEWGDEIFSRVASGWLTTKR